MCVQHEIGEKQHDNSQITQNFHGDKFIVLYWSSKAISFFILKGYFLKIDFEKQTCLEFWTIFVLLWFWPIFTC